MRMLCVPVRGMCGTRLRPGAPGSAGPRTRYTLRVSPHRGTDEVPAGVGSPSLALARCCSSRLEPWLARARAGQIWLFARCCACVSMHGHVHLTVRHLWAHASCFFRIVCRLACACACDSVACAGMCGHASGAFGSPHGHVHPTVRHVRACAAPSGPQNENEHYRNEHYRNEPGVSGRFLGPEGGLRPLPHQF